MDQCCCVSSGGGCNSPIVIDVNGDGFSMCDFEGGVTFDLNNDGVKEQLSWTAIHSDDAWLALDRNGNGKIDSGAELFGNYTPQEQLGPGKNGYLALAEFDKPKNGGNGDGLISEADAVFQLLRLWNDFNHNGESEPSELVPLEAARISQIALDYKAKRRTDEYGNYFRYRTKINDKGTTEVGRFAWDVFLMAHPVDRK